MNLSLKRKNSELGCEEDLVLKRVKVTTQEMSGNILSAQKERNSLLNKFPSTPGLTQANSVIYQRSKRQSSPFPVMKSGLRTQSTTEDKLSPHLGVPAFPCHSGPFSLRGELPISKRSYQDTIPPASIQSNHKFLEKVLRSSYPNCRPHTRSKPMETGVS